MSQVYLSLGSNIDAEYHIRAGISALESAFEHCEISPIYRSRAVGFEGDDFINLAVMIETDMDPGRLRAWLRDLEDRHGRNRDLQHAGPVSPGRSRPDGHVHAP